MSKTQRLTFVKYTDKECANFKFTIDDAIQTAIMISKDRREHGLDSYSIRLDSRAIQLAAGALFYGVDRKILMNYPQLNDAVYRLLQL